MRVSSSSGDLARRKPTPPDILVSGYSIAKGQKRHVTFNSAYLTIFLAAANSAAAPSLKADAATYEWAKVSTTVTSHIKHSPLRKVLSVMPSGRLPSDLARLEGSFIDETCARVRARHTIIITIFFFI